MATRYSPIDNFRSLHTLHLRHFIYPKVINRMKSQLIDFFNALIINVRRQLIIFLQELPDATIYCFNIIVGIAYLQSRMSALSSIF